MALEGFNPFSKQYKEVEDLPDEEKSAYKGVDGGGFVTREASDTFEQAKVEASERNKKRSIKQKITGKDKVSGIDILQEEAIKENEVFETRKKQEKEREKLHLLHVFRHNVFLREMYLIVKRDEWGFYSKRKKEEVERLLQESILRALDDLQKNGNDLARVQQDIDSMFGDGYFEKSPNKDLYISLQTEIAEEEKRAILREELHKRHSNNQLFKTKWLAAPEDAEDKKAYVSVFCATNEGALGRIGQAGLKFAGEEIMNGTQQVTDGEVNVAKMKLEKIFQEVAPVGFNRRLSVFAVPEYRDSDRSGAMGRMGNVILEIMVNADHAMVFDVEKYNSVGEIAQFSGEVDDQSFHDQALGAAEDYWAGGMFLSEYLKLSLAEQRRLFTTPEILIPDAVSPDQINVVSVLNE